MTLSLKNRTGTKLRVVLPPGLIVSGATGQFGGGMGAWGRHGRHGRRYGRHGGGMGAWRGMGGMGGGMGRGRHGGGMMGRAAHHARLDGHDDARRLIMNLVGEKDSWISARSWQA